MALWAGAAALHMRGLHSVGRETTQQLIVNSTVEQFTCMLSLSVQMQWSGKSDNKREAVYNSNSCAWQMNGTA